jgi:hypothetical protein
VPTDLTFRLGPAIERKLLDPLMQRPTPLKPSEFNDLVSFVRNGLLDARVNATNLCQLVPAHVPSGNAVLQFEACR